MKTYLPPSHQSYYKSAQSPKGDIQKTQKLCISRRIQDEYNLNDRTKGAQLGEGDLAQGGILRNEIVSQWSTLHNQHHPAPSLPSGLSFCPLTPAFLRSSPKDMVGGQPSTCMPRGMAASSMSSSRMWMATMSTDRPCVRQGHRFPSML